MTPTSCPYCGRTNDRVTDMFDLTVPVGLAAPSAGDVSVCWGCAAVAVFTGDGMAVRAVTDDERAELLADADVADMVGHVLAQLAGRE